MCSKVFPESIFAIGFHMIIRKVHDLNITHAHFNNDGWSHKLKVDKFELDNFFGAVDHEFIGMSEMFCVCFHCTIWCSYKGHLCA